MKTSLKISVLIFSALFLTACGGNKHHNEPPKDQPKTMPMPKQPMPKQPMPKPQDNAISGYIQKLGGGHTAVHTSDLDHTTYNSKVLVSLKRENALFDIEQLPKKQGGQQVDGSFLGVWLGDKLGAIHIYDSLSYARFGDISAYNAQTYALSDTTGFYQGTPSHEMQAGGIINYEGAAYQFGKDANGKAISDYNGKLYATADLTRAKIDIKLSNVTVPVEAQAKIHGNTFSEDNQSASRQLMGGFFGPNGAEIAGMMEQKNNGEWTATFGGKRK